MKKVLIVTDLDGTLLDPVTYSFGAAVPALKLVRKYQVPLVICSSKTRAEIEYYRNGLEIADPFISENGGGVFIPLGYFRNHRPVLRDNESSDGRYWIIRLGEKYENLRKVLMDLQDEGFSIWGFGDMTPEQLALHAGFSEKEAIMARKREFDEPFLFDGNQHIAQRLVNRVKDRGYNITRATYYHIMGNNDKGEAISLLTGMYVKEYGDIFTIAIGDSPNDLSMLQHADRPVIVERPGGGYDPVLAREGFERAKGVGPAGWNHFMVKYLATAGPETEIIQKSRGHHPSGPARLSVTENDSLLDKK